LRFRLGEEGGERGKFSFVGRSRVWAGVNLTDGPNAQIARGVVDDMQFVNEVLRRLPYSIFSGLNGGGVERLYNDWCRFLHVADKVGTASSRRKRAQHAPLMRACPTPRFDRWLHPLTPYSGCGGKGATDAAGIDGDQRLRFRARDGLD